MVKEMVAILFPATKNIDEVVGITYKELAYKNNVGITLIGYIVNNKVWKHV